MNTVKQFIKDTIKQFDPTLDVSESSTITDLLINPASAMLDPVISQINYILDSLGLTNISGLSTDELDQIASNFLIYRNKGSKSTGFVELYYNAPQSVFIPKGTICTGAGGQSYQTTRDFSVSLETMANNMWSFPLYSTGAVPVESVETGSVQSIPPNSITSIDVDPAPVRVTNPSGFSGGSDAESNQDFVDRLTTEVISGALGSADGIKTTLNKQFPTIQGIKVRGMNDVEMIRDLVISGVFVNSLFTNIDYFGRVSGLSSLPYPESYAYRTVFYDDPTTSGVNPLLLDLPYIDQFYDEFTTDEYAGMYRLNDTAKAAIQSLTILDEPFEVWSGRWRKTDGMVGLDTLRNINEVTIENRNGFNKLRLGLSAVTETEIRHIPISIPIEFLYDLLNMMRRVSLMPPRVSRWQPPYIHTYTELIAVLNYLVSQMYGK
jgi:hypothetical protein